MNGGRIIKFPRFTADVISVVLEFIDTPEEYTRLRLVNRTFDQAAYRILLYKQKQASDREAELHHFLLNFIPEDDVHLQLRLENLEGKRRSLLKKVNTT